MSAPAVAAAEHCYLRARDLADRLELAAALGTEEAGPAADAAFGRARRRRAGGARPGRQPCSPSCTGQPDPARPGQ
ncbi:hypothetical protein [Catellatospora vulcania]|uniref:hypothetical protein n=1 Tax=Catellatospora vulcania TaxID=1460450 RepID=UPI0012D4AEE9|nr:hypothetical protein [Catellatospora vulcania]